MKRIAFLAMMLLITSLCQAQTKFFGLELGQSYTADQVKQAVGTRGTFEATEDEGFAQGETFSNVTYEGYNYANVAFIKNNDNSLLSVTFDFADTPGSIPGLDDEFKNYKSLLEKQGDLVPDYSDDENEKYLLNLESTVIILNRILDGTKTSELTVSYMSMEGLQTLLLGIAQMALPEIQEEFFGMKMGNRFTESSVKNSVGTKGTFLESTVDGSSKKYTYKNVIFAGHSWSFGEFYTTPDGRLYQLSVYDSLDDYSDERRDAESTFSSYKRKLDEKYGEADEEEYEDGSGKKVTYFGSNHMCVILSNKRSRSTGGSYRRYVTLSYVQAQIHDEMLSVDDDEL